MVLVLFFPFQLPKFGSFDLPPQILVIAPLGLCPTAAKGEEKPFPFREGTLTLPMTVSALVLWLSVIVGLFYTSLSGRAVLGMVGLGVGVAKQEADQKIILPKAAVPCAVPGKPKEQQPLLVLRDSLGSLGSCLCCFLLLINECLLLQAQRVQKVQQTQLCDPAVPLPSQDRYIHLCPLGQ